ncbi:MAG TPA: nitroreductase family protein [Candidatus Bathyarchaeia archaeon]|nr:nitroreductase family protein [Candidatus Bathyarchaeia archaeon]
MTTNTKNMLATDEAMRSRHSVRKYEPGVTIPEADLNEILELASTAPSSWNLQHWRFLVVQDQENKERLLPIAYNQKQVVDCSAVIVILGDLEADQVFEEVYGPALKAGAMPQQAYDTLFGNVKAAYTNNPELAMKEAHTNAALAAMQLMLAAKAKGYDTVPMGGFDREALIKELRIPSRYVPVMMISLGKAASPAHATGRFPLEKVVIKESF